MSTTLNTTPDEPLAARYLDPQLSLPALAQALNCSLEALLDRIESASFQALIERLKRTSIDRAKAIAALSVQPAMTTLASLLTDRDAKPETRRKAARELTLAATASPKPTAPKPKPRPQPDPLPKRTPAPHRPASPPPIPLRPRTKSPAARLMAAAGT